MTVVTSLVYTLSERTPKSTVVSVPHLRIAEKGQYELRCSVLIKPSAFSSTKLKIINFILDQGDSKPWRCDGTSMPPSEW